jgi:tripartite-type tricarboxylate transporter receptor subunit TctC
LVGAKVSEYLGQPVVIDDRAGASGSVGTELVAKSAPDGYTFLVTTSGHTILPNLSKLPWDPITDFTPVAMLVAWPLLLAVNPKVPATSFSALIDLGRRSPGSLNFGTAGVGTAPHLAMELLMSMTGAKFQHVPYRGNGPATVAAVAGETQIAMDTVAIILPRCLDGGLRPLAVVGSRRLQALPDVPTIAEAGLPQYDFTGWTGVLAPKDTPREHVDIVNAALRQALADPQVTKYFADFGYEIVGGSPDDFARKIASDQLRMKKIIENAGLAKTE